MCLFVFTSCLRVSLCVPVFGCVVGTPISVFSVLGLLQPSKNVHVDAYMYTCFGWMRDINKNTAWCLIRKLTWLHLNVGEKLSSIYFLRQMKCFCSHNNTCIINYQESLWSFTLYLWYQRLFGLHMQSICRLSSTDQSHLTRFGCILTVHVETKRGAVFAEIQSLSHCNFIFVCFEKQ